MSPKAEVATEEQPQPKNKLHSKKVKATAAEIRKRVFMDMPTWKSLLIMSWPAFLQMLLLGSYTFVDTILSVNFATDSYKPITINSTGEIFSPTDQVRVYMTSISPIMSLLNAFTILFSIGVATRASINVGQGNIEKARQIIRTGTMVSTIFSFLIIPILAVTAESWIGSQYSRSEAVNTIKSNSFSYIIILIGGFPFQAFWQVVSSYFRIDGRNRQVLLVAILPIPINLFLDWLLMGPAGMAIDGGAWATLISNVAGAIITIYFLIKYKSDTLSLRDMFNFRFRMVLIIGIVIAGITPFIRNLSLSVTQGLEVNNALDVSTSVYSNAETLQVSSAAAFQVFAFVFPLLFSFTQSGRPIVAFNYGAKQIDRVKSTFWWIVIYSTITGLILYGVFAYAIIDVLLDLLRVETAKIREVATNIIRIMMASLPVFSITVAASVLFSSTDRVMAAIIISALRNFILIFPFMYAWKELAKANTDLEYLYWSFYPIISGLTSLIGLIMAVLILKKMKHKFPPTLDERIRKYEVFFENIIHRRREKKIFKRAFE